MRNIVNHFDQYFKIVFADTPLLIKECLKLRYEAFCLEKRFFIEKNADAFEIDEYDPRSLHALILHKSSGSYIATIRLVMPSKENCDIQFPLETQLSQNCLSEYNNLINSPRMEMSEISRLLISKQFRRREGDSKEIHGIGNDFGIESPKQRREFTAQISLGLFKAIYQLSVKHRINYWLALMEPQLIRLLGRIGIRFNHLSEHIQYCGDRLVCFEDISALSIGVHKQRPDIWDFITDEGSCLLPSMIGEKA